MIGCASCGAHGPVRNDYPADPTTDDGGRLADDIETWTAAAWNRMPAVSGNECIRLDARIRIPPDYVQADLVPPDPER
jgi:hypothetical protein